MGIESFIPEKWSGNLQSRLHANLVFGGICNRNYEGEVVDGDRVRISQINSMSATAYTPNTTTLTYNQLDGAPIFLDINRRYTANFYIEDLDAKQARGNVVGEATGEMAFTLGNEMDAYIASLYSQAQVVSGLGTSGTPLDITSLNVTEKIGLVQQKLDEANVPMESRYIVVSPWFLHKIELADITLNTANSATMSGGFRGNYLGLNIFVSNNVSESSAGVDSRFIAGYNGSITLAQQISKVEALRAESTFRDLVRALNVYGAKVTRPNATACLRCDYTVEP